MNDRDLIDAFLKDIEIRGWSVWTIKSCKYTLNLFVESIGPRSIIDIETEDLKTFLCFLQKRKARADSIASETIRKHFNNLASFYEFLEEEDKVGRSLIPRFRKKYLQANHRGGKNGQKRQIIELNQMRKLIGSILDPCDRAMLMFLAKTGIRAHELISLDVTDIHLDKMTFHLKATGKRGNSTLFFDDETRRVLERWLDVRSRIASVDEKALYLDYEGKRISQTTLNKRIKYYAEQIGIHDPVSNDLEKKFTTHCFRHFFTTYLLRSGMRREFVKELRGDSRSETIDIYHHILPEELREEYLNHVPGLGL